MRRVYRPTLAGRALLGALGVGMLLLGLFLLAVASFADGSAGERVGTIAVAVLIGTLGVLQLFLLRVRLETGVDGILVVNYASTHRFAWGEIDRFEVGYAYWGVTLVPRRGAPFKVNAIQKTNLAHWLGRTGRADRIVGELNAMLAERRGTAVPPPPPIPPRPA